MMLLLVVLGSAVGAPARYLVDRLIQTRDGREFPLGTFAINVTGSFLLGLLVGTAGDAGLPAPVVSGLGIGLLGSYTTFSTFIWETLRLVHDGSTVIASVNVVLSVGAGAGAAALGMAL